MNKSFLNLLWAVGGLASFGTGLSRAEENLPVVAWQGRTMGSPYTVKIVDSKMNDAEVTALKLEIEAVLKQVNQWMSNYEPESELSRFNRALANVPFKVSADFARVTRFGLELSRISDGAFDPTLGPLINVWGFGEKGMPKAVPSDEQLAAAKAKTGWRHLKVTDGGELVKDLPEIAVDLGAVAKGFGVDEMVRVLRAHGVRNLYASIAGEVRVMGLNPRGGKWMVGVSVPKDEWRMNDPMAAAFAISNLALSTSGDYQKFFVDKDGRRMCHIIDGKTGTPVQHSLAAVTVVGPDNMTADGIATTLFVLGEEAGMKIIESRPDMAALFILREKDGSFRQIASSRLKAMTGYKP